MEHHKLLITGSRGRIGKILTNLKHSYDIYGVDIVGEQDERNHIADISNYYEINYVFKRIGSIRYVIHLAAAGARNPYKMDWGSILRTNIIGTKNVYECARLYGVKRVIFASTNHVTGGYEGIPPILHKQDNPRMISVSDPVRPDSDYATSKVFGEALARQYYELYGLESICLRIGSVLEDDDPTKNDRFMKTWLSHRDLVQLVSKSLSTKVKFGIYYGVSNNKGRFWDILNAEKELGYKSQDDASLLK
jgi:nucleoside-diphosphate-sugar epimerase